MHTILAIVGARPQFIKHAVVQRQLEQRFRVLTMHTGQHSDDNMSRVFFDELHIPTPDFQLATPPGGGHGAQTGSMMKGVEEICVSVKPDAVLIYGDTNTTLAGALVAVKLGIPFFHVEAGIRGYNRALPEEVNRVIADTFSSLLFCPTKEAVENLRDEGIAHKGVMLTGDVMCDLLRSLQGSLRIRQEAPYYYVTIHRPYNTDNPARLEQIIETLNGLNYPVCLPLHPRTRQKMQLAGLNEADYQNIRFSGPVSYLDSLSLQYGSAGVITDSSGVQKEAYMLRRKCVTVRSETEWNDTLKHGWNNLVFEDLGSIQSTISEPCGQYDELMFGDGQAAICIADAIEAYLVQQTIVTA